MSGTLHRIKNDAMDKHSVFEKRFILPALTAAVLGLLQWSCTEPLPNDEHARTEELVISAEFPQMTKAPIFSQYLNSGSKIGVTLVEDGKDTYDGVTYHNIMFTAYGSGEDQYWASSTKIDLSETKGTLYAYYPYTKEYSSHRISASAKDSDVLWCSVSEVSRRNNRAHLQFDHTKALLRVKLLRGDYIGHGNISIINVIAINSYREADLNILTGEFDNGSSLNILSYYPNCTLDDCPAIDFLLMPNGKNEALTISSLIDETDYQVGLGKLTLSPGKIYETSITLNQLTKGPYEAEGQVSLNTIEYYE